MRYVVGYTATPSGADAFALGVRLARTRGAELVLVLVLHNEHRPTLVPADPGYDRFLEDEATGWLRDAAAKVPEGITVSTRLVYAESFSEGLMAEAEQLEAGLIVVGAARGGMLGRASIGSVAADLLHSSTISVALAPAGTAASGADGDISRITAAIGTKAGADVLLHEAIAFSGNMRVPLRLISLIAVDLPGGAADPLVKRHSAIHAEEVLAYATERLPAGVEASAEVAVGGSIEAAVGGLDWNKDEIAIVGSSRLAQPRRLFIGSTAAKMLRELPVPMIVVPRETAAPVED